MEGVFAQINNTNMTKAELKTIFGKNYIGLDEQKPFLKRLGLDGGNILEPDIDFSDTDLIKAAKDGYILIYGIEHVGGVRITLKFLRDAFGIDPSASEPCLYNQDWYMSEVFMDAALNSQWYLIKKDVYEDSRGVMPLDLIERGIHFPSAILCGYTFFAYYFYNDEFIWWHDFIWCCDLDHNGDRIYVGKYHDIDGVNKNGFSIHRHLALRPCYASIDYKL